LVWQKSFYWTKHLISVYKKLLAGHYADAMSEDLDWWNKEGQVLLKDLPNVLQKLKSFLSL
jgi:hypothetical protein